MSPKLFLAGHTVVQAGWPHDAAGHPLPRRGGDGIALCSCGATSPLLDSDNKRKRWHQGHKRDLIEALGDAIYVCSVDACTDLVKARGLCSIHLHRLYRHGDPLAGRTPDGALPSFIDSVLDGSAPVEPNGCILWPYGTSSGYPIIHDDKLGTVRVGAVILARTVGSKPSDRHTVGHAPHEVCGNTLCIAPAHLSWQTWDEQATHRQIDGTAARPEITDELVADAVARVRAGESRRSVADDLGVSTMAVHRWVHGHFRTSATRGVLADA